MILREVTSIAGRSLTERTSGTLARSCSTHNCLSGKYSPIPLPQHTHPRRPPPQVYVPGCSGVLPSSVVAGSSKRSAGFFFFHSAKVIAGRELPGHQWELQAACQAGGPGACAPPTASLGGRPAWPRVTAPPAPPQASRGVGHAAERVWSVPRPAPGARFSPQCVGAEVRGSYPSSQSQSTVSES